MLFKRVSILLMTAILVACGGGSGGSGGSETQGDSSSNNDLTYAVNVNISGLNGVLSLTNNGTDLLSVSSNGTFSFTQTLSSSISYSISIQNQPDGQTCTVSNATGSVGNQDVSNIEIACSDDVGATFTYRVSGSASGVTNGSVTLRLNNTESVVLSAGSSSFQFTSELNVGDLYDVKLIDNQTTQVCNVANAAGTVSTFNITNLALTCSGQSGFNLQPFGVQTNSPSSVVVTGLRVTDRATGKAVSGLAKSSFIVKENNQLLGLESFVDAEQANDSELDLRTVLILDVSTSLLPADIATIKAAAKSAIYTKNSEGIKTSLLVAGQKVAVYTFDSGVDLITDFTDNLDSLEAAIDNIDESLLNRANSTNLFDAVTTGVSRWNDGFGLDSAQFGYAIIVSDGNHNTDNRTPENIRTQLNNNNGERKDIFAIALGDSVSPDSLAEITGSSNRVYSASNVAALTAKLQKAQQDAIEQTKGLYRVYYATPKRSGTNNLSIELNNNQACSTGETNCVTAITGSFSANGFKDIVPEVKVSVVGGNSQQDGSLLVRDLDQLQVTAKLRWINVAPVFTFEIDQVDESTPVFNSIGSNRQDLSIPQGFGQARIIITETNTGLTNTKLIMGDFDGDGIGNAADTDDDGDSVLDVNDCAPFDAARTLDTDADGSCNENDIDDDNDQFTDIDELAAGTDPLDFNSKPLDTDGDFISDVTDSDIDGDGEPNTTDDLPLNAEEQVDTDGDKIGNKADLDDDGDQYSDIDELAAGTDPLDADSKPLDTDGDFISNVTDADDDGDGISDAADCAPLDSMRFIDTDMDGVCNDTDNDDDGDKFTDADELSAGSDPLDVNSKPLDTDGDFISDATDTDIDGDGELNATDALPLNPTEQVDTDLDGIGNNADTDDDNDQYTDIDELAAGTDPLDVNSVPLDTDGDFISDTTDTDIDGDGVINDNDLSPNDAGQYGYYISGVVSGNSQPITVTIDGKQQSIADGQSFNIEVEKNTNYELSVTDVRVFQNCSFDSGVYLASSDKSDYAITCTNKTLISEVLEAIQDSGFKQCIIDNTSGKINLSEVTSLYCYNYGIIDSSGLDSFTALTNLNLLGNSLTQIDISKNILLVDLNLSNNQLTVLDLSQNIILEDVRAESNQLTALDVSNNTQLQNLRLSNNQLGTIDVLLNAALVLLELNHNQLTAIDVSANTALTTLSLSHNLISNLDVSTNTLLTSLSLNDNELSDINVEFQTALEHLSLEGNDLSSIDIQTNTALTYFSIGGENITSLNVSAMTALKTLVVWDSAITSIDLSANTNLEQVALKNNLSLAGLDISSNTALTALNFESNGFTSLNVTANTSLTSMIVKNHGLSNLNVSANTLLFNLDLSNNNLTTLDTSNNAVLQLLKVQNNQLSSLNFTLNTALNFVNVYNNLMVDVPAGISAILDVNTTIRLTSNSFDANAVSTLEGLKSTYPNLSW